MEAKELITQNLKRIVRKLTKADIDVQVSVSEKPENGDYYSNVALRLAGVLKQKPLDIAYKIKDNLDVSVESSVISKIEVVPPGFVNFFLSEQYLKETIDYINKKHASFGSSDSLKNQKIMVEFTDPNPFKEFHIGHLYSNIVGESISRLFESQGAQVWRVCYQGDVGLHVSKAIYGMMKLEKEIPDEKAPLSVRAQFMGRAYTLGSKEYEISAKKVIEELNKKVYDRTDERINDLYDKGRRWSLEYFDSVYNRLGTHFRKFYFESQVGRKGLEIVRKFLNKGIFEQSEGAVIFPGKKYGLHNRVFINSFGLPTYEAKDLGLAESKKEDYPFDLSISVTGSEINEYFKVILKVLEIINPKLRKKMVHVSHGMVRMPGGKMSSRTGEIITGEWLMDEAVARIRREYPEMDDKTSEKVGLGAIKFALLKNSIGGDIEFNFKESIALIGASGPYLQYTYVRTKSVVNKYKILNIKNKKGIAEKGLNSEEMAVLRTLVHFPEIVSEASKKLSPNLLASYLFVLSQKFNLFYQKHRITGNKFRLELTTAVGQILKNGLALLGIETVDKM